MMRMILIFMLDAFLHRIVPRNGLARRTNDRIKIRREPIAVPPLGEEFAVNFDADSVVEFGDGDLGECVDVNEKNDQEEARYH